MIPKSEIEKAAEDSVMGYREMNDTGGGDTFWVETPFKDGFKDGAAFAESHYRPIAVDPEREETWPAANQLVVVQWRDCPADQRVVLISERWPFAREEAERYGAWFPLSRIFGEGK